MGQVLSFLFDRLTDPLGLPIEAWKEYIILLIIGELAYIIAFYIVGGMYDSGDIIGSDAGSFLHWGIRLIIFVIMWGITYFVIWLVKLIFSHWIPVVCAIGGAFIVGSIVATIILIRKKRKKIEQNEKTKI